MDVFISYRREGALEIAGRFYERFKSQNYTVFYDIESMNAGKFNEQIYKKIERCRNFVLVLPPNSLDRCKDPEDWVRKEIRTAIKYSKHIVLLLLPNFKFPDELPEDIAQIKNYQGVQYVPTMFTETFERLLDCLVDENGQSLRVSHDKMKSNMYYEDVGMSDFELGRIKKDFEACRHIESKIFDEILEGKKDVAVFNPAIYEITTTMQKYDHPAIKHVFGFVCNKKTADEANAQYGNGGQNEFFAINFDDRNLEDVMDTILEEHHLDGFDFVDLTLILKDSDNPFKRLRQITERLNEGAIIYVRELDDDLVLAYPDHNGRFQKLLSLFRDDQYAGARNMGRQVYTYLSRAGATEIKMIKEVVSTAGLNTKKRRVLFDTYFSYLVPEINDLYNADPENDVYINAKAWLDEYYDDAEEEFLSKEFFFVAGFVFFYARFDDV